MTPTITSLTDDQKCKLLNEALGFINVTLDGQYGYREDLCGKGNTRCFIADPLRDLNAAITLCDMLAEKGWDSTMKLRRGGDWLVKLEMGEGQNYNDYVTTASSLATAISHAALIALNLATK